MTKIAKRLVILATGLSLALMALVWAIAQPVWGTPMQITVGQVEPRRLEDHVRALSEGFAPRDWRHPENLDRAAAYIQLAFERAGGRVQDQPYAMDESTYRNVIAVFGPETRDAVVVGAHYDAFDEYSGADDNASGVAGLLELARALRGASLRRRVELVAFTLEEPRAAGGSGLFRSPYGGSAVHAESLHARDADVRLMLSLETIGFYDDGAGSQRYPAPGLGLFYPDRGDFVAVIGKFGQGSAVRRVKSAMRSGSLLPVFSMSAPIFVEGVDWSDHANYWRHGWDAVMVTDTAIYRNPHYHTAGDTFATLDYRRMALVVEGVLRVVTSE